MSKPFIHSLSSVKKWGGVPEDYTEIHTFMDSSKGAIADNRHRTLTHNAWFLLNILERIKFSNSGPEVNLSFPTIINSDKRVVSIRDIGEQHILEDYGNKFIPSAQDFLENMDFLDWMDNGASEPNSFKKLKKRDGAKGEKKVFYFKKD